MSGNAKSMIEAVELPLDHSASDAKTRYSISSLLAVCVFTVVLFASDLPAWKWMYEIWTKIPDNSHGILVPAFSIWLLWNRRHLLTRSEIRVSWVAVALGIVLIVTGILVRCSGIYTRTVTLEAVAIIPSLFGIVLIGMGWTGLRWAWPSLMFLVFMIPLPRMVGGLLAGRLQQIATKASTYFLQLIGIPAISEGNIIWLTRDHLGVAEACSGLRMLMTFFALAVAAALVQKRPLWEKLVIVLSAPVIAIASNVLRIAATAIAYEFGDHKTAELIFHDFAGWLMMPAGLAFLWLELFLLSKLFEDLDDHKSEPVTLSS